VVLLERVPRLEETMTDEGPRYNQSAKAAQDIMNLYLNNADSPAIRYAKILYRIKEAMEEAERELAEMRLIISRN
jgi:hypothetical protein